MLKFNIQLFGGRGASSNLGKSINGIKVVNSTQGYQFWNIGRHAPEGYIGLINGSGANSRTAYIKSSYANEIRNNTMISMGMNYESIRTLDSQITRLEKKNNKTLKDEQRLKSYKRAREIRKVLGL